MKQFFDNSDLGVTLRSALVKANVSNQFGGEPIVTEQSLQKAVEDMDLLVYEEDYIKNLGQSIIKGHREDKTISEDNFEKAKKDLGKLIKTTIIDKHGVKRIVYVARKEYKSHTDSHSDIHATIARQKALLANPKSPASARKRAEEILKVEEGKLAKISVSHEPVSKSNISDNAKELTKKAEKSGEISDHDAAAEAHRFASRYHREQENTKQADAHDLKAQEHRDYVYERDGGKVPSDKKPQITYKRVSTNEPNVSDRTVSHEVYVDGKFRGRHAEADTAKELIDELVEEGGEFKRDGDESVDDNYEPRWNRLPGKNFKSVEEDGTEFEFDVKTNELSMNSDGDKYVYGKVKDLKEASDAVSRVLDGSDPDWKKVDDSKFEVKTEDKSWGKFIQIGKGNNQIDLASHTDGRGTDYMGMMTALKKNESFVFSNGQGKYKITSKDGANKYNVQELSLSGNPVSGGMSGDFKFKAPKDPNKVDKALDKLKGKADKVEGYVGSEGYEKKVEKYKKDWKRSENQRFKATVAQQKRDEANEKKGAKIQKGDTIISFDLPNDLEKGGKDIHKLIKTTVTDKNGHQRIVYISRQEYESHTKSNKTEIEATIKRQKSLLANSKSPASAKAKAYEILKIEEAKLAKIGGGEVKDSKQHFYVKGDKT